MKEVLFNSPLFGIVLTLSTFQLGKYLYSKKPIILFLPFLFSMITTIAFLLLFDIPISYYNRGGSIIQFFLGPTTVCFAIYLYLQLPLLKKNWLPVLVGTLVGALTAILSIIILAKLFKLDEMTIRSFLPKSITTPLGIELSKIIKANTELTILAISVTGITGNIVAPLLFKLLKIKNPIVSGVALGVSSHAFGTQRALQLGEEEGALSALSLVITGLLTILVAPIIVQLFF